MFDWIKYLNESIIINNLFYLFKIYGDQCTILNIFINPNAMGFSLKLKRTTVYIVYRLNSESLSSWLIYMFRAIEINTNEIY